MSAHLRHRQPEFIPNWKEERRIIADTIRNHGSPGQKLTILEAGCGLSWGLDLGDREFTLTGIDIDQPALDQRLHVKKDLDRAICGDLRTVHLEDGTYDVIFNSYVMEHIQGARDVLLRFERWLKPGGIMILIIPNRDSVWGFLIRMTPFWFHIFFKRYVLRDRKAGSPGYGPFRTYYDKVVSRRGIHEFCEERGLVLKAEYSVGNGRKIWTPAVRAVLSFVTVVISIASFGTLARGQANLMYIIERPLDRG